MKIGIIGHLGMVGKAVYYGMKKIGHDVKGYDIADESTSIMNVIDSEICFICVPTKAKENWQCDVSIVEKTIDELINKRYNGIIVIKSTVEPGTSVRICSDKYSKICFVPEFLRERCAITDFLENHDVCIIGVPDKNTPFTSEELSNQMYQKIVEAHGNIPKKFVKVSLTEAELCKYFNNIHNMMNIIFANSFYEVCQKLGVNYTTMKNAIVNREHITDIYLDCNDSFRGGHGPCLPKDTKAMAYLVDKLELDVDFFACLMRENEKYPVTVWPGMRKE